jgi:hypothetical protein
MGFEMPKIESKKLPADSLDDVWYEKFKEVGAFADFEYLSGNKNIREVEKQKFLKNEVENPELDYPGLEKFNFEDREKRLLELKDEIIKNETNSIIKQLYRWKLNEKIAELRMLKATKNKNDRRFELYSKFIYGNPEKEIYNYTLLQLKKIVDEKITSPDAKIRSAAQKIHQELFEKPPLKTKIDATEFRSEAIKFEDQSEYGSAEIKTAFENALAAYRLSGWRVIVEKEKTGAINVSQEKKEVAIPKERRLRNPNLQALIKHEIGTHVLRREAGEKSKLKLLGLGLDRYLKGEEGIATYREQEILGLEEFTGLDGHLAISLANGLDGKKRTFREVFEILQNFYFISSKKERTEALKLASNSAWDRCIRTFRGTTCKTPGACFTKDIVYREGNIGIWNVVKNNPEEIRRFSIGKYDPANPRHIWILEQLGITETDLENIEKDRN